MPSLLSIAGRPNRFPTVLLCTCMTMCCFFVAKAQGAETHRLVSKRDRTALTKVAAKVEAKGKINVVEEGQTQSLPLVLTATMDYDERVLENTEKRTLMLRQYRQAEANIRVGQGNSSPRLDSGRLRVAVELRGAEREILATDGPLTREELDLLQFPGSSLPLELLLPSAPVKVGETWKPSPDVLSQLLAIDAAGHCEVEAVLAEIQDSRTAKIVVMGHVEGAIEGVSTDIDLEGEGQFDPTAGAFRSFSLKVKEKRAVGHVGPGLDVECQVTLRFSPAVKNPQIGLAQQKLDIEKLPRQLTYAAPSGKIQFEHGRNWHVVEENDQTLVLRMISRGELVAQCNVTLPGKPDPKNQPTLEKFTSEIEKALGERFGKFVVTRETTTDNALTIFHVVAEGKVSDLPIQWHYYLAQDDSGRRAGFVFTLEPKLLEKLDGSDAAIIRSLKFLNAPGIGTVRTSVEGK